MVGVMDTADREALEEASHDDPPLVDMIVGPGNVADNRRFGELLAGLRHHAGTSRADAAETLGMSVEYLRLIETGKRTPALGQMRSLLAAYGARGEVNKLMPGGDRQDLTILDPLNDEPVFIKFTSRIREARRRDLGARAIGAKVPDDMGFQNRFQTAPSASRAAELGFVVSLLPLADDKTIREVADFLKDKVDDWG